ncbi:MAG: hypothetical protein QOC73_691 [Actinomycetota bacterium]|nr:hypothetical protein [Actinomycetota bacterium]
MLRAPGTAFVVVAAPEPDALREASFFVDRLVEEEMPLAGVVVNRVHRTAVPRLNAAHALSAADDLDPGDTPDEAAMADPDAALAAGVLRLHAKRVSLQAAEERRIEGFVLAHPQVRMASVTAFAQDVHDLAGLRALASALCEP